MQELFSVNLQYVQTNVTTFPFICLVFCFVKSKSCLTNLLETMDNILEIVDQGSPVDILYFDFKKAFDHVHKNRRHTVALYKND